MLAATAADARAGNITSVSSLSGLGAFSGQVSYTAIDADHAMLSIELWNTSPTANGGYLTAFAFENPSDRIDSVSLSSSNPNFEAIGGPDYRDAIAAPPFGDLDLGASTSDRFLGGGSPVGGIAAGDSSTFAFTLTGNGLDELTAESFFESAAAGPVGLLARFRGFRTGGSDKVPGVFNDVPPSGDTPPAPEPATLLLGATAMVVGLGYRRLGRRSHHRLP